MKKILIGMAAILCAACSSKDLYDEAKVEELAKSSYAENFSKKYPHVDLNQSWDYSHKNPSFSLPFVSSAASTRGENPSVTKTDEYTVDQATLTWMKNKLKDGINNSALGKPFYMSVPNNSFTIVPIYQGQASSVWELHAVIDGVDYKVWEKGQDVWLKTKENEDWKDVKSVSNQELYKCTENAITVKANGYQFDNFPVGKQMYFYLRITNVTNSKYNYTLNAELSSLAHQMLALQDCPRPANIPEDHEVMIIGCEDIPVQDSDKDFNDVVFLVYAKPHVPQPIIIEDGDPIVKKETVRYMIEDLGSTDDFDFNDIVVDVSDVWTSTPTYVNGVLDKWTDSEHRQEATIRHLGGTLPFILKIGDTERPEHAGVMGSDPDETFAVSGWNKDTHNIVVKVRQEKNSTVYNEIKFPKAGTAPMIIAVDPTQTWMSERQSVPESWFYIPGTTEE
ncbi:MAG: DUF4114 domain-containing protein [Prevotella sp.]|nr:DUF4114 domain-containing protein [Prevotella sp.]